MLNKILKKIKRAFARWAYYFFYWFFSILPLKLTFMISNALLSIAYASVWSIRKLAKESLTIARKKKVEISHEIADVAVYLIELADNLGIDLAVAIAEKMEHNEAKYPADKVRGSSKKYTEYKTTKRLRE